MNARYVLLVCEIANVAKTVPASANAIEMIQEAVGLSPVSIPRESRIAECVQVSGLMIAIALSHPAEFSTGKMAPEVSHMGMSRAFITP